MALKRIVDKSRSGLKIMILSLFLGLYAGGVSAQTFELIPLGVHGGGEASNLSAYLIAEKGTHDYLCLDAGTLRYGIKKAIANNLFHKKPGAVLRQYVKAYFISHGHLDHVAGLIINSPYDSPKPIYALPFTIRILKKYYFTNGPWTNFANKGSSPQLGKYTYKPELPGHSFSIQGTNLTGRLFELSHVSPYKSSAILVTNPAGNSVLYLGDTGADRIEKSHDLEKLWTAVAPLVTSGQLKGILIEVSFPNSQPTAQLFGHLTPKLLYEELQVLAQKAGLNDLSGLKIIVTHLKPEQHHPMRHIKSELMNQNSLNVDLIFPKQGQKIVL